MSLTLIARAGKDAHRHVLWTFRCSCGRELVLSKDKAAKRESCGDCKYSMAPIGAPVAAPTVLSVTEAPTMPPVQLPPSHEPVFDIMVERTADVIKAELVKNASAIRMLQSDILTLSDAIAKDGVLGIDNDGVTFTSKYREACSTANVARKERVRLERELRELLNQKAVVLNTSESVLARARKRSEQR